MGGPPARGLGYAEASDVLSPTGGQFAGHSLDGTALLVRTTLTGDANLDGTVDFDDLVRLAQNYNTADGQRVWYDGDFDYDGNVDFDDLVKLAQNYNSALPAAPVGGAAGASFDGNLAAALANVPEPSAVAGLILLLPLVLARRGRGAAC